MSDHVFTSYPYCQVTSQGDVTMRTDKVRERFGLDGQG
jgi:hypothetical protein